MEFAIGRCKQNLTRSAKKDRDKNILVSVFLCAFA